MLSLLFHFLRLLVIFPLALLEWLLTTIASFLGVFALPLLLVLWPLRALMSLLGLEDDAARLTGDWVRPLYSHPWVFARGEWVASEEQPRAGARFELGDARLELKLAKPVKAFCAGDVTTEQMVARALAEPPLDSGMRWAGLRISHFGPTLQCVYVVWKDDEADAPCLVAQFSGPAALEEQADDFIRSVLPALPGAPALQARTTS